ncbi:UNVERIFIED_CONTAM: hypothetical protein ABID98_000005 [Brevibacillus sp. OAP136]
MANHASSTPDQLIARILHALEGLQYGSVQIVVHDSQVIQIDRTEKHRFPLEKADVYQQQLSREKKK